MIDWQQFHFLRPGWFLLLLPLAWLAWRLLRTRAMGRGWAAVCDPALLPHVLVTRADAGQRRRVWPLLLAGLIAIVALAGPAWTRLPQPVFSSTRALVIALDLSLSMNATDVAPSRVERARFKIADLLRLRRDGQTALLVYAGEAFTVAPLTDDAGTLLSQLPALTPAIMPVPGNRAAAALVLARDLLRQADLARGDVLLVTDEVEGANAVDTAAALRESGYRVSVLGVGTTEGAPIPRADGSFLEDDTGQIIIAALDAAPLRAVARAGGGVYQSMTVDDRDVGALATVLDSRPADDEARATELQADTWRDAGVWLVLALLPLALLGFRRGLVLSVALLVTPLPRPAAAMEWQDLWLRPDQQGVRALERGDAARAAELLADPRWQGAARYRAGEFEAAAGALDSTDDADSRYNRGNALARLGRYPEAVAAYDEALQRQPDHADARYNRELVQQALAQQQQQQQQQPQPQGKQPDDGQQQQGEQREPGPQQGQQPQGNPGQDSAGQDPPQPDAAGGDGGQDPPAQADAAPEPGAAQAQEREQGQTPPRELQAGQDGSEDGTATDSASREAPVSEDEQAMEQWLRRIPDDPGGLLRRKFQYQHQVRRAQNRTQHGGGKTW